MYWICGGRIEKSKQNLPHNNKLCIKFDSKTKISECKDHREFMETIQGNRTIYVDYKSCEGEMMKR